MAQIEFRVFGGSRIIELLLGWLYKAFLRNLHDNQRQKLIEPLRHRFEEKLKTQAYVCKKCGNGYRPVNKDSCYAHVGQPMMTHIENVRMIKLENNLIVFFRCGRYHAVHMCPISPVEMERIPCPTSVAIWDFAIRIIKASIKTTTSKISRRLPQLI